MAFLFVVQNPNCAQPWKSFALLCLGTRAVLGSLCGGVGGPSRRPQERAPHHSGRRRAAAGPPRQPRGQRVQRSRLGGVHERNIMIESGADAPPGRLGAEVGGVHGGLHLRVLLLSQQVMTSAYRY